ncbi:MAG: helix-turn-helix domain-containing protein [Gammaproteobacteria bacterium]|nr:helix-turn-helix domain-containing protein [Gammaproteobacteria bacterium]
MTKEDKMLTLNEVAKHLNVSRRTIERYIAKKLLVAIKYDRAIRVPQSELDRFKEERRTN